MAAQSMQEWIDQMRGKRGWSLRRLAEELGYSSATSLVRIAQGSANAESVTRFAQAVEQLENEPLDEEETAALAMLMERKVASDDGYRTTQLLISLLRDERLAHPNIVLESPDGSVRTDMLSRYAGREGLRVTVLNCEHVPLFDELAELEAKTPFPIKHYLVEDGPASQTVERIRAILPVLFSEQYQVFSQELNTDEPMGMLQSDLMVVGWQENGQAQCDLVTFLERERGFFMHYESAAEEFLPLMMIALRQANFHPVRLMTGDARRDFLDYCIDCTELERDRTVMRIKPEVGIEQIPVDILADAFAEGCPDQQAVTKLLPPLRRLFEKRHRNARVKHQPQYHVLMRWGMWRFVRTGCLSDHPWLLRPFTVAERKRILQELMTLMRENPYFNLRFARDDDVHRLEEFIYYEGKGLYIIKPNTDYRLDGGHAEVVIRQKKFTNAYRRFYLDAVLNYRTMSAERSYQLLGEMLRYLNDHADGKTE